MAEPRTPAPVKLFVAVLANPAVDSARVRAVLEAEFGPVDEAAGPWPHEFTDYYRQQMGGGLLRSFYAFERLIDPAAPAEIKLRTNELERTFAGWAGGAALRTGETGSAAGRAVAPARPVNLDPGYVDDAKVVLVSLKDFSHRVYLGRGVYGEVTLSYEGGQWRDREFTFPDYRTAEYKDFFSRVRAKLRRQRATAKGGRPGREGHG
jgi:hypothetical protein